MGVRGPKPLSADTLARRGSKLAAVRAREERQQSGFFLPPQPKQWPLPRTLSTAARTWGKQLMTELIFDVIEHQILIGMLKIWDQIRQLEKDVAQHGVSRIDKNGHASQRPEARMLVQQRQVWLSYMRVLQIKEE